jgi:hypothetical protein
MWVPKYNDHHNHKRMWNRMHQENSKIQAKKRLMSQQKKLEEVAECTFTPKLFTRKKDEKKPDSVDVKHLTFRLYQYADQFKKNKETLKKNIDVERKDDISFHPKLQTARANSKMSAFKDRKNVYDSLYNDYNRKENHIKELKEKFYNSPGGKKLDEDQIYLTVMKPIMTGGMTKAYLEGNDNKLKIGSSFNGHIHKNSKTKSFSSTIYSENRSSMKDLNQ